MSFKMEKIYNQSGWLYKDAQKEVFITELGGHMMPVNFHCKDGSVIKPYFCSPWQEEPARDFSGGGEVLAPLRGDFFCLPFGGNAEPFHGIQYPAHGETACFAWEDGKAIPQADGVKLEFTFQMKRMPGKVTKRIGLKKNQNALYIEHEVLGCEGRFPVSHHSILSFPEKDEKMYLSFGKFELGETCPGIFSNPANKEFGFLPSGKVFTSIEEMPTKFKDPAVYDYSTYPSPVGYADLFTIFKKPSETPAWTAACYPKRGYIWFALKNAAALPNTCIWVANEGRYEDPWNGRTRCLGVEDGCSYFDSGVKQSCEENDLTKRGWPTAMEFRADKPTTVRMLQGVVQIPPTFGKVKQANFLSDGVCFTDVFGATAMADIDWKFLM